MGSAVDMDCFYPSCLEIEGCTMKKKTLNQRAEAWAKRRIEVIKERNIWVVAQLAWLAGYRAGKRDVS